MALGHSDHFLNRLTRTTDTQSELALLLYNNPQILKYILSSLNLPDTYDRIAISLQKSDNGPFLVISKKGDFITCLGLGMSLSNIYLFSYSRLIIYLKRWQVLCETKEFAKGLVREKESPENQLLSLIFQSGIRLSREEMVALSVLEPALIGTYCRFIVTCSNTLINMQETLFQINSWTSGHHKDLKKYWNLHHALGHLMLLTALGTGTERDIFLEFQKTGTHSYTGLLSFVFFSGDMSLIAKAVWSLGKLGKQIFSECKSLLGQAKNEDEWLIAYLGLIVIALRNRKLQSQIIKLLKRQVFQKHSQEIQLCIDHYLPPNHFEVALLAMLAPERSLQQAHVSIRKLLEETLPKHHFLEESKQIPLRESLSYALWLSKTRNFRNGHNSLAIIFLILPWLATCEATDFYLPQKDLEIFIPTWTIKTSINLIKEEKRSFGLAKDKAHKKQQQRRNDLCSCGSGQKFKNCCLKK